MNEKEKQIIKEIERLEQRIVSRRPQIDSWRRKLKQNETYHWEQLTCKGIYSGAEHERVENEAFRIYQCVDAVERASSRDRVEIRTLQGQLKEHYRGARLD